MNRKQKVLFKYIILIVALAAILMRLRGEKSQVVETSDIEVSDTNVDETARSTESENEITIAPSISYEKIDGTEETEQTDVAKTEDETYTYPLADWDKDREIRVLLTNPDGGYFFEKVTILLGDKSYSWTEKQVRKRGTIRFQAGSERMVFAEKKSDSSAASYKGSIVFTTTKDGIYAVNILPLEEYLKMVVPSEMPASYPYEALKSQTILARTYAARYMLHPALSEYGADLDDTTSFQVYGNQTEKEETNKAIKETEGTILAEEDALADVYYFSTSCGYTTDEAAWKRIPNDYQQAVYTGRNHPDKAPDDLINEQEFAAFIESDGNDAYEADISWHRWSYEGDTDSRKLFKRIKARAKAQSELILTRKKRHDEFLEQPPTYPGKLKGISIIKRAPGGCAEELLIEGELADIKVCGEYNIRYVLCDSVSEVCLKDGSKRAMQVLLPSAFFVIKSSNTKGNVIRYILIGGGFGHGIGMSQNGAAAMAKDGFDYRKIIEFFYPKYDVLNLNGMGE